MLAFCAEQCGVAVGLIAALMLLVPSRRMMGRRYGSGQWPDFRDDSIDAYPTGNSNEDGDSWVQITQEADDESSYCACDGCPFD